MNAVEDAFRREKFAIKCECVLEHSEPGQVGLLHTRTPGTDRHGLCAVSPGHLASPVSSVRVS